MTVHSFSSAAGAAAPLTRARVSGSLPVWSLSLGCPKNRVDTEHLLGSLGMPVHSVEHMGRARLVFINTCGFIEPAVRESIRSILDAVERLGRCKRRPLLAVAGCMVGRYGVKDLAADLPEVDLWLPTDELENWPAMVREALGLPAAPAAPGRLLSTGPSYAWLKVGEGCRHKCAFCTIPSIRGPLRSVPAADLREEARGLLAGGVRELVLVAQDLTSWGSDFDTPQSLPHLLDELLPLDRLTRLRLLYLYPSGVTPELLRYMREAGPQLLPYFDIPLQHAHPEVLTRMGRPFANAPRRVVARVRVAVPEAALRTTFSGLSRRDRGTFPDPVPFRGRDALPPPGRLRLSGRGRHARGGHARPGAHGSARGTPRHAHGDPGRDQRTAIAGIGGPDHAGAGGCAA